VTPSQSYPRARIGALLLCCAVLPALSGCSIWNRVFHRYTGVGCNDKPFKLNTDNRPVLKVPEGMSAPDTRNAIRIPDLSDHPERARTKTEPCLAEPPNYFATPLKLDLPPPRLKPKHWWQIWRRKLQPPAAAVPNGSLPEAPAPALPAPATPVAPPAPAPVAPDSASPPPATSDSTPK
jgi:hypothetical protein